MICHIVSNHDHTFEIVLHIDSVFKTSVENQFFRSRLNFYKIVKIENQTYNTSHCVS